MLDARGLRSVHVAPNARRLGPDYDIEILETWYPLMVAERRLRVPLRDRPREEER